MTTRDLIRKLEEFQELANGTYAELYVGGIANTVNKVKEWVQELSVDSLVWHRYALGKPNNSGAFLCKTIIADTEGGYFTNIDTFRYDSDVSKWQHTYGEIVIEWADVQVVLHWTETPTMADFEI